LIPEHVYQIGSIASWDNVYQEELVNFEEIGDEGEIWYCDSNQSLVLPNLTFPLGLVQKLCRRW